MNLYPKIPGEEVIELDDEVMVTINLVPGRNNRVFSCAQVNEKTLKISCDQQEVKSVEHEGYSMIEQHFYSLHREISLPAGVSDEGATSPLKHGVLDIHLMKTDGRQNGLPD